MANVLPLLCRGAGLSLGPKATFAGSRLTCQRLLSHALLRILVALLSTGVVAMIGKMRAAWTTKVCIDRHFGRPCAPAPVGVVLTGDAALCPCVAMQRPPWRSGLPAPSGDHSVGPCA